MILPPSYAKSVPHFLEVFKQKPLWAQMDVLKIDLVVDGSADKEKVSEEEIHKASRPLRRCMFSQAIRLTSLVLAEGREQSRLFRALGCRRR